MSSTPRPILSETTEKSWYCTSEKPQPLPVAATLPVYNETLMANYKSQLETIESKNNFRFIQDIDSLSSEELEEHGYYKGFPCVHNHTIRDKELHWCYHCVLKIKSNICGFDVNYLDASYKHKCVALWNKIRIGSFEDCWEIKGDTGRTPKRLAFPSYRTAFSANRSENVTVHKIAYQCAWGDIGAMVVTRVCQNKACCNPLHLISSWNRVYPPSKVYPFEVEFKAEKLMQYARARKEIDPRVLAESQYKNTIEHPLVVNAPPDYDEG